MLAEIEEILIRIIQEELKGIPKENISVGSTSNKLPAVLISNVSFDFENCGLAEKIDEGNVELEESFRGDGKQRSFNLNEKPVRDSVRVEWPQGTLLAERKDFDVNYDEGTIHFNIAPLKGKDRILVKYLSQKRIMKVKGLKVKANYAVDVFAANRVEIDALAEKVVKALLMTEDELASEGIYLKAVGGESLLKQEGDKTGKMRLNYLVERDLTIKKLVTTIEKITITKKNI